MLIRLLIMQVRMSQLPNALRFQRLSWGVLFYTLAVILFGAWVRITGSGAGCGQHWPSCHGDVVPRSPGVNTMIEWTHRATSGVYGLVIIILLIAAFRLFPAKHWARRGAVAALLFTLSEGLIGRQLVMSGLVGMNDSPERALWMALHLINTLLLTAAVVMVCWASKKNHNNISNLHRIWPLLIAIVGVITISATGAITALGDTLYPVMSTGDALAESFTQPSGVGIHFLQQMRVIHPFFAVGMGIYLLWLASAMMTRSSSSSVQRSARWLVIAVLAEVCIGVVNIILSAPGWLQIVHLFVANLLWIVLIWLTLSVYVRGSEA